MLLGNYSVLNRNPVRFLGGSLASPEVNHQPNFYRGGARKNRQYVAMTTAANKQFSIPRGKYPNYMWLLAQKGGDLSAPRTADFTITTTATGGLGMPGEGSTSFTISTNNPEGQLIVSGTGSASFVIDTNTPLLTASINGDGSASFVISTNTPILGAEAGLTATVTITFSASLVAYAIGIMEGTTEDTGTVTNVSVARAVWDELLSAHTEAGSAGLALATASSGGVDPTILAAAVWAYVTRTLTSGGSVPADIAAAVLAAAAVDPITANTVQLNSADVIGDGTDGNDWRGVGVPPQ